MICISYPLQIQNSESVRVLQDNFYITQKENTEQKVLPPSVLFFRKLTH